MSGSEGNSDIVRGVYSEKYVEAINKLDAINAEDPNVLEVDGEKRPVELLYAERMTEVLQDLYPSASELLSLAIRAQHLGRWKIARSDYPEGKAGYFQWRNEQKRHHAEDAATVLMECGYSVDEVQRVKSLIRKEKYKSDEEAQALEDVACVVFLKYYFDDFIEKYRYDDDKMINILRKTWVKMSDTGHKAALALEFPEDVLELIKKALAKE